MCSGLLCEAKKPDTTIVKRHTIINSARKPIVLHVFTWSPKSKSAAMTHATGGIIIPNGQRMAGVERRCLIAKTSVYSHGRCTSTVQNPSKSPYMYRTYKIMYATIQMRVVDKQQMSGNFAIWVGGVTVGLWQCALWIFALFPQYAHT